MNESFLKRLSRIWGLLGCKTKGETKMKTTIALAFGICLLGCNDEPKKKKMVEHHPPANVLLTYENDSADMTSEEASLDMATAQEALPEVYPEEGPDMSTPCYHDSRDDHNISCKQDLTK
jgi:hypothetical protein